MTDAGDAPHPLLKADAIRSLEEVPRVHQFNPRARRWTRSIGDLLGLSDLGVHLVRVEPGDETTEYHHHHRDEEFIYILEGRGLAEIGDDTFEVGPGDFMGFIKGSLPHCMSNPFDTDLVYLMGGTRQPIDICDYPRLERRMYRVDGVKEYSDWDQVKKVTVPVVDPGDQG